MNGRIEDQVNLVGSGNFFSSIDGEVWNWVNIFKVFMRGIFFYF